MTKLEAALRRYLPPADQADIERVLRDNAHEDLAARLLESQHNRIEMLRREALSNGKRATDD